MDRQNESILEEKQRERQAEGLRRFREMVAACERIVFFGGAGVSTESGIPDFRSVDGLYHQKYQYPPETILSHSFFVQRPEEFFEFYFDKLIYPNAEPNTTHLALARLEREGKLSAVITQNIDGLHQKAGSKRVLELHGSVLRNYCQKCARFYSLEEMKERVAEEREAGQEISQIPRCTCGGRIKPDVVLYEEALKDQVMGEAVEEIEQADLLIVGGTSLSVYPAAGLIRYFRGGSRSGGSDKRGGLVLINKSETPYDNRADLVLHMGLGEVFGAL